MPRPLALDRDRLFPANAGAQALARSLHVQAALPIHSAALKLGPTWWSHGSPQGLQRFQEQTAETAGFHNTIGRNAGTRTILPLPPRHGVARRIGRAFLPRLVAGHRLPVDEAVQGAVDLVCGPPKEAHRR